MLIKSVNCDDALSVKVASQETMLGITFAEVKLHRKSKANSLASMNSSVKVGGKEVVVKPQQMVTRILSILDTDTDLATYMKYELAPRPSLFDDISLASVL